MWKLLLLLSLPSINQVLAQERTRECYNIEWSEVVNVTSTEVVVRWQCCNSRTTPSYTLEITSSRDTNENCDCGSRKNQDTNECVHTFSNLCPNTKYIFTVSSKDSIGYNRYHSRNPVTINFQTKASTPGNVTIEAKAINETAVNLNWENDCPNGEVMYNVTWSPDGAFLTRELSLTVVDLRPATLYTFVINACNVYNSRICSGSSTVVKTLPGESSEPTMFEVVDVSSSDVHLRWNHPDDPNGPIDGYEIDCRPESNATFDSISTLINRTEEYLFTGLEPWTKYSCSIQAFNFQGLNKIDGRQNTLTTFTKPARPDEPQNLEIVRRTSDELFLKWQHPFAPRGPIDGYVIIASNGKIEIESMTSSKEFRLSGLSTWTLYNITVHAFNVDGNDILNGTVSTIYGKTRPAKPSAPRDVKVVTTISGEIYLKWKRPLIPNGEIHGYLVKNLNDESEVILPASILEHHLNTLIPDTNYTLSVHAYNVDGTEQLDGTAANVNHTTKPAGQYTTNPAVSEMISLLRKDIISEFSKTQSMIRKMLRNFAEESDVSEQKHDNKSVPETAPEYRISKLSST